MPLLEQIDVRALRDVITTYRDTVREHAGGLNRLNVYPVPDGDTGTNMSRTLDAVVTELENADPDDLDATCDAISHGSLMGARGNSGVILSQILRGIASTIKAQASKQHAADSAEAVLTAGQRLAEALASASTSAYQAVLKPIEGTILTVVRESAEAARASSTDGQSLAEVLRAAKQAGRAALDRTPELLPVLKDAGVVDAGGAGYLLLLDSALYVVDGEPLPPPDDDDGIDAADRLERAAAVAQRGSGVDGELDVSEQRYEVMYLLNLDDSEIEEFKSGWGAIGDSIVVVGGDGIWNCHIHTNDIGGAIEVPLALGGRPHQIRVTDLFEEVEEVHATRESELMNGTSPGGAASGVGQADPAHVGTRAGAGLPPVTTAVVAVSSGDGLLELFSQLEVQGFVHGGQTMNPSTAELLDTVEHVNADQVIILPNNSNIIPVAQQVDALTTKTVAVVPTRTVMQALAALFVYDPEASAADNLAEMTQAADSVTSGEVTQAVRTSNSPAGPVAVGDWIGIIDGVGIAAVAGSALSACTGLLETMLAEGPAGNTGSPELLTLLLGADADESTTAGLTDWLTVNHPDIQVETHDGGQPLYPYLFGVE